MTRTTDNCRGITLVEVTVVGILAALVMLALSSFYINSQGAWIDASAQAVTQRDGTLILQAMSDSIHGAATAKVTDSPPTLHLYSYDDPVNETCQFRLEPNDQLIHLKTPTSDSPIARSIVTRFEMTADTAMVHVDALELLTSANKPVILSGSAVLYNR